MDHKAFLKTLDPEVVADLTERSTTKGLVHLAGHLAVLLVLGLWIAMAGPLWWAALVPYGIALIFLFTLEHECLHQTPFAHVALNEVIGRAVGAILILPFEWFRYFHLAHHRHTNIPGKDPELARDKPTPGWRLLWYVTGLPVWWALIRTLILNASGRVDGSYVPDRARPRIVAEARWHLGLYAVAGASLLVTPALLTFWLLPMVLGQPFLRLYLLAEHGRCAFVADMFQNTRTTFTNGAVRFLAWNMPFHAEHHTNPNVPFHKLPALHARLKAHLQETSDGYGAFLKSYVGE